MAIFQIENARVNQIHPTSFKNEKDLQSFFERNLEDTLGIRFVATEFPTGDRQRGRIDTLGLDQDNSPVIIEFKYTSKENVVNQGLYYLDWLMDHKGDFLVAAQKKLGKDIVCNWSSPRLLLIAENYSEYDKYAVKRMGENIEFWVYRLYEKNILYLEPLFLPASQTTKVKDKPLEPGEPVEQEFVYDIPFHLKRKPPKIKELFEELQEKIFSISNSDDITENPTKTYIGYKRGKNFCEIELLQNYIKIWLDIEKDKIHDEKEFGRDVSKIGHHGTGKYEIKLSEFSELDYSICLIEQSYKQTL